jgi:hypothetical protein
MDLGAGLDADEPQLLRAFHRHLLASVNDG